jgi:hypothetical protein
MSIDLLVNLLAGARWSLGFAREPAANLAVKHLFQSFQPLHEFKVPCSKFNRVGIVPSSKRSAGGVGLGSDTTILSIQPNNFRPRECGQETIFRQSLP